MQCEIREGRGDGGVAAPQAAMMRSLSSQNYKGGSNIADLSDER